MLVGADAFDSLHKTEGRRTTSKGQATTKSRASGQASGRAGQRTSSAVALQLARSLGLHSLGAWCAARVDVRDHGVEVLGRPGRTMAVTSTNGRRVYTAGRWSPLKSEEQEATLAARDLVDRRQVQRANRKIEGEAEEKRAWRPIPFRKHRSGLGGSKAYASARTSTSEPNLQRDLWITRRSRRKATAAYCGAHLRVS